MRDIHHDSRLQQRIELNRLSKAMDTNNIQKKKKKNIRDRNRAISAIMCILSKVPKFQF